jgi:hypothetical protein
MPLRFVALSIIASIIIPMSLRREAVGGETDGGEAWVIESRVSDWKSNGLLYQSPADIPFPEVTLDQMR